MFHKGNIFLDRLLLSISDRILLSISDTDEFVELHGQLCFSDSDRLIEHC